MKMIPFRSIVLATALFAAGGFVNHVSAQANFDLTELRQRQMERYREVLGAKSDDEWKKLEPLITKVLEAQRAARAGTGTAMRAGGRRGGGDGGEGGGNRARATQANPEAEALQKAIDENASADDLKAKLAKLRESRKAKETALEKAQDDLRKALTPKQEASAVLAGLVK